MFTLPLKGKKDIPKHNSKYTAVIDAKKTPPEAKKKTKEKRGKKIYRHDRRKEDAARSVGGLEEPSKRAHSSKRTHSSESKHLTQGKEPQRQQRRHQES